MVHLRGAPRRGLVSRTLDLDGLQWAQDTGLDLPLNSLGKTSSVLPFSPLQSMAKQPKEFKVIYSLTDPSLLEHYCFIFISKNSRSLNQ